MMRTVVVQRLRVTYSIAGPLCYTSVLDMGRLWERLLRRARVPLAYTQGYSPHPRLQFAAALPVGYGSVCEILDILLAAHCEPLAVAQACANQAPQGLAILQVERVPLRAEIPQSLMQAADYRVNLLGGVERVQMEQALACLLARKSIPRQRIKKGELALYDLRSLIYDLRYVGTCAGGHELLMALHCGPQGAGRPEEIIAELGLPVTHYTIQRLRLIWGQSQNAAHPSAGVCD